MTLDKKVAAQASFWLAVATPFVFILYLNIGGREFLKYSPHRVLRGDRVVADLLLIINLAFLYWVEAIAFALALSAREYFLSKVAIFLSLAHIILATLALAAVIYMLA